MSIAWLLVCSQIEWTETTLRSAYGTSTFKSYNVIVPDLGTYAGTFMIASLEYAGEYNGEATYV